MGRGVSHLLGKEPMITMTEIASGVAILVAFGGVIYNYVTIIGKVENIAKDREDDRKELDNKVKILEESISHLRGQKANETRLLLDMTIARINRMDDTMVRQQELQSQLATDIAVIKEWVTSQKQHA
jgi:hypothetical protein